MGNVLNRLPLGVRVIGATVVALAVLWAIVAVEVQRDLGYVQHLSAADGIAAHERFERNLVLVALLLSAAAIALAKLYYNKGLQSLQNEESLRIAALVYSNSSESMMITNRSGIILDVNPAFLKMTGYGREEVIGKTPRLLKSGFHDDLFWQEFWERLNQTGKWSGEIRNRNRMGQVLINAVTVDTVFSPHSPELTRVALLHDVTHERESQETIWRHANYDTLTGLPNRRLFLEKLDQEIRRAMRDDRKIALLFLDIDRFKEINDSLGHPVGDHLLGEVAARLLASIRNVDTVSRMGGDEFTVILTDIGDAQAVETVSEKIRTQIAMPFVLDHKPRLVTVSIGIAVFPDDADDTETLIRNADQAMFVSKKAGRNRYTFYSGVMQEESSRRLRLAQDLEAAIRSGQLVVHYQPIVELPHARVRKAEALIRWKHPVLGLLMPSDFIRYAEDGGLIEALDDWVLREVSAQIQRWPHIFGDGFQISVNKTAREFHSADDILQKIIASNGSTDDIVIEITESVLMSESVNSVENMMRLRQYGATIALDDFGTGYSSLSYLAKFPVSFLKIDKSFIADLLHSQEKGEAICQSIIALAHNLGIKVIAEGVESAAQDAWLKFAGCDFAQGYYYAHPMPAEEFERAVVESQIAGRSS